MDVAAWCKECRVWVVAGKGGVGKTTIAAAMARMAAEAGLSVLVIELEGKQGLPHAFGQQEPLSYVPAALFASGAAVAGPGGADPDPAPAEKAGRGGPSPSGPVPPGTVWARRLTPDDALLEYLADHGLHRVSKRLVSSGVLDVVATAIPGIRDVLVLGKVKQLERADLADVIVVDAPATGHAMTFLTSASGLLDAARSGPVRAQASEVVELLQDPARCRVLLVTLPEEMPVSETIESAYQLEDRVGIRLGPVVVNCAEEMPAGLATTVDDAARSASIALDDGQRRALEQARRFRLHRAELAEEQIARLQRELPLPHLFVPQLLTESVGPDELGRLSDALGEEVDAMSPHAGAA